MPRRIPIKKSKAEKEHDILTRITEYMLENKRAKLSATVNDLCKVLDVSAQTVNKYMKLFTNRGHFKRDRDLKQLYWLNVGDA